MATPTTVAITSLPFLLVFLLVSPITILFLVSPHLLAPKTLPGVPLRDELDDLALFRRAVLSETSSPSSLSSSPPRKIAFLFLTNSDITFAPLWECFFQGNSHLYNIYIHADPTTPVSPPGGVFRDRFVPGKGTQRASPTLISAARRLIANALLDDPSNAFFALLSQHCVPIHSFAFVYNTLFTPTPSPHHQPISFIDILANESNLMDRYVARGLNAMLREVPFDQFRGGSQFFILARRHAALVVGDRILWKKFRMPCLRTSKYTCYPEEHYFPTLLSMQNPDGCSHYTLTRVKWTGRLDGHPYTYRAHEVSAELVRRLRLSNFTNSYLFARKFTPDCLQPLMGIAETVIFRD